MNNNSVSLATRRWFYQPACQWLCSLLAVFVLAAPALAQSDDSITPNFRDTDIREIVDAVQTVTGKNFLVDSRVNAKVTLYSSTPMTADEFYAAFLSILTVNQFQAVPAGNLIKIVPIAQTRQEAVKFQNALPDELQTTVIRLQHVPAAQLVPLLRPLLPAHAHLAAMQSSNSLVISDSGRNIQRIRYLIRQIDRPVESDVEVIRLAHASADDIVTTVNALNASSRADATATGQAVQLVADARTNSVLVSGPSATRLKTRTLIAQLDSPQEAGGLTQVRYLRYALAEELATKLAGQVQSSGGAQGGGAPSQRAGGEVNIWADERTNALVMTAPQAEMRELMSVIDKLDVRRAQVLVEALIVEVTVDRNSNLGVTWAVDGSDSNTAAGITDFNAGGGATVRGVGTGLLTDDNAAIASAISTGLTLGVGRIADNGTSFAAILSALQGDANTNVISTPTLVTLDNQEAKIEIGQEVPFITGQFTNSGGNNNGAVNPFQTVNREKIGTLLEITPQINEGNAILMKIKQEISSLSNSADAVDLITNERLIETSVIIEDGGILVLGGLIEDTLRESDQRVPILGSIPVLGNLFRSRRTEKLKTNLMVFIKPRILRDGISTLDETNEKYNYLRDLQQGNNDKVPLMRDARRPVLPPFEDMVDQPPEAVLPENIMQDDQGGE
ncbi:MAG: type II secretion system secretin GspD [Pseudomonadota bacterium]